MPYFYLYITVKKRLKRCLIAKLSLTSRISGGVPQNHSNDVRTFLNLRNSSFCVCAVQIWPKSL